MAALDYLQMEGLAAELKGGRLRVTPASRITDNHRQYLWQHRAELLAELAANDALTPEQIGWLASVASCLGVSTGHLLERGFIDRHDLVEQIAADPHQVAALIKSDPRWYQS
ncbi:hypothetical protein [Stutzerimonas stutzeri]|uniref:hypothetical protein n=1 Tax=Stutzerimonas stutzeri TaxID=316 RepID=UPI00210ED20C|nr:hypothetical protein [Stutzerimonas stutzeri]MCQ4258851.1 hypothetical protein [Stutzerimonas stutzeri]